MSNEDHSVSCTIALSPGDTEAEIRERVETSVRRADAEVGEPTPEAELQNLIDAVTESIIRQVAEKEEQMAQKKKEEQMAQKKKQEHEAAMDATAKEVENLKRMGDKVASLLDTGVKEAIRNRLEKGKAAAAGGVPLCYRLSNFAAVQDFDGCTPAQVVDRVLQPFIGSILAVRPVLEDKLAMFNSPGHTVVAAVAVLLEDTSIALFKVDEKGAICITEYCKEETPREEMVKLMKAIGAIEALSRVIGRADKDVTTH